MITEATFTAIKCDNCGILADNDGIEYWMGQENAWDMADMSGWQMIEDEHFCPECYSTDDEDNDVIDLSRKDLHNNPPTP